MLTKSEQLALRQAFLRSLAIDPSALNSTLVRIVEKRRSISKRRKLAVEIVNFLGLDPNRDSQVIVGVANSPSVKTPPGHNLLKFSSLLFSARTYREVFEPAVLDMRVEYFEALDHGDEWRAKAALVRGYWGFAKATGLSGIIGVAKDIVAIWRLIG